MKALKIIVYILWIYLGMFLIAFIYGFSSMEDPVLLLDLKNIQRLTIKSDDSIRAIIPIIVVFWYILFIWFNHSVIWSAYIRIINKIKMIRKIKKS